jgi:hypothetical protein
MTASCRKGGNHFRGTGDDFLFFYKSRKEAFINYPFCNEIFTKYGNNTKFIWCGMIEKAGSERWRSG